MQIVKVIDGNSHEQISKSIEDIANKEMMNITTITELNTGSKDKKRVMVVFDKEYYG